MKAAIYKRYGPAEVVQLAEMPKPAIKPDEILIAIHATTVNRTDTGFRSAEYFVSRFFSGLWVPKNPILGCEFAGVVAEKGHLVKNFEIGDCVFGFDDETFGSHAEFKAIAAHKGVAHLHPSIPFETGAAIAEGAHYALGNIRASKIKAGEKALVYGASGAIGSAYVQLLKFFGVDVTAVVNAPRLDLMLHLGITKTIDYEKTDYTATTERYHVVFDAVGKTSFAQAKKVLLPGGVYISTEPGAWGQNIFFALMALKSKKTRVLFPIPTTTQEDMIFLGRLTAEGHFRPVIDSVFPFDDIVAAHKYVSAGQKTGNVVVRVQD